MNFFGHLDEVTFKSVSGWAWCQDTPSIRPIVQLIINDELIAEVNCNQYRSDLASSGIGDGAYGFNLNLPTAIFGELHVIISNDGSSLQGSPVSLNKIEVQIIAAAQFLLERGILSQKIKNYSVRPAKKIKFGRG